MIDSRMFDFQFYYDRIASELPDGCVVAEVGVAIGASALYLAKKLNELGKRFTLYMIDDMSYGDTDQLNILYKNILQSGLGENIELIWMDSLNASCRFPDSHFDFVFVDASHKKELTKADARLWFHKIKEGGILAGHDYYSEENPEVKMAIDEVIPYTFTREPIMASWQFFQPERILQTEQTTNNCGLWWLRKVFYLKLN